MNRPAAPREAASAALDHADQAYMQAVIGDEPCLDMGDAHDRLLEARQRVSEAETGR